MKVRLRPPNARDEFHLIEWSQFIRIVDQQDLARRNSETIIDAYHEHWLASCEDGIYLFHAPEFYLEAGIARFINGRHRTLLLGRHLSEFPMALANMDGYPISASQPQPQSMEVLKQISKKKLDSREPFELPDLPIKYLGYDHNIGK